ncbi:MAG: rhodanese-like domain-containing protein [Gramella sp.]|nr:rhodanese-like domain-containing protein [Christiangramia sp.]
MIKNFLFLLFATFICTSLNAQNSVDEILEKYNSGKVPYITAEELRMHQLNEEVIILDTRNKEEFEVSHLSKAILVGYDEFDLGKVKKIDKDQKIVVYCSIGVRSENIGVKLIKAGYKNVENLYGGIFDWKNKDFPVVDALGKSTEKVHAYSKHWSKWLRNAEKIY